jgi:Mg-chelatase subunit ChlD
MFSQKLSGHSYFKLETSVRSKQEAGVNVVFCFDTTGSMSPVIKSVKNNLTKTVTRLFNEIKDIHIGMIAFGDYCDYTAGPILWKLEPTDDIQAIQTFVSEDKTTGGGDLPEMYEHVLKMAVDIDWTSKIRVLVMIGDQNPHDPGYQLNVKIPGLPDVIETNWVDELKRLKEKGVNVFSCHAMASRNSECVEFYKTIANTTGGLYIEMDHLGNFPEFMIGICLRVQDGADDFQVLLHKQQELLDKLKTEGTNKEVVEKELKLTQDAIDSGSVFSPMIKSAAKNVRGANYVSRVERFSEEVKSSVKESVKKVSESRKLDKDQERDLNKFLNVIV